MVSIRIPLTVRKLRFTKVFFGVSASPFLLNATINHHLQKHCSEYPDLVNTLMKSSDDVTYDVDGEDEAYTIYSLSKKVFADSGFNSAKVCDKHVNLTAENSVG